MWNCWSPSFFFTSKLNNNLSTIKTLCVSGCRLHSTQPKYRHKSLLIEPMLGTLRIIAIHELAHLTFHVPLIENNKERRTTCIAIVLRNLIFQDQMVSKCIPCELREQAMVLVQVMLIVREDEVGVPFLFKLLEKILHLCILLRKVSISKILDDNFL